MKITKVAVCIALFGAVAFAGWPSELRAKIPFDFIVADQVLPAGEYSIARLGASPGIRITSVDLTRFVAVFPTPGASNRTGYRSAMTFNKYGDQYFLKEIWTSADATGTKIPECRTERKVKGQPATEYTVAARLQ